MKYEKATNFSAALHRIFRSCVGALPSVALFRYIFSIAMFFGFIRVYTVLFSDPILTVVAFNLAVVPRGIWFYSLWRIPSLSAVVWNKVGLSFKP